jgi:hypothetical protein
MGRLSSPFMAAMTRSSEVEGPLHPVQGAKPLPLPGPAHQDPLPHEAEVKGVHGLGPLQHHVVGDVHDVADGAHAGGEEGPLQGDGAWPYPEAKGVGQGEVGGAQGVFHLQAEGKGQGLGPVGDLGLHQGVAQGVEVPGQAQKAQGVRAVGGDLYLQDHLLGPGLGQGGAGRKGLGGELQKPPAVLPHPELLGGEGHAEGAHPLDDPLPHLQALELGPGQGQGHADPGPGVLGPRDHLHHLSGVQDQAL